MAIRTVANGTPGGPLEPLPFDVADLVSLDPKAAAVVPTRPATLERVPGRVVRPSRTRRLDLVVVVNRRPAPLIATTPRQRLWAALAGAALTLSLCATGAALWTTGALRAVQAEAASTASRLADLDARIVRDLSMVQAWSDRREQAAEDQAARLAERQEEHERWLARLEATAGAATRTAAGNEQALIALQQEVAALRASDREATMRALDTTRAALEALQWAAAAAAGPADESVPLPPPVGGAR